MPGTGQRTRLPGFVDLQVNGHKGINFSSLDLTEDACAAAFRGVLAAGTAAFLPTVITSALPVYRRNLPLVARVMARDEFRGRLLGFHLEGPFISAKPGAVGAHDPRHVQPCDPRLLDEFLDLSGGTVKLVTIAAELEGAAGLARRAIERGVVVSLGHQLASADDLARLADAGARALTHLGNGVPNVLPRHPNVIWAGLADDRYTAMLITDGHHLPASFIAVAVRAKGVARFVVVSDASSLAGMPPGTYSWGGATLVIEPSGRLHDPAKGCLAGSSFTMLECMNHLASLGILDLDEMMRVGRTNPLALVGCAPDTAGDAMIEYDSGRGRFAVSAT